MEITQEVDQPSGQNISAKALADQTLSISKRSIKTQIVINSGNTAVLGGLMKDRDADTETKVPILGDIPILGWLFKSKTTSKEKANLLVFITPKIIRGTPGHDEIVGKAMDKRIEFIKQIGGRDPYGKQLDSLPRMAKGTAGIPADSTKAPALLPEQDTIPSTELSEPPAPGQDQLIEETK
jgi:general secretion pathway protein D